MPGPLDGVRIVDVSQMISGPLASMLLADQGADVIKIEPPGGGDPMRAVGRSLQGIAPTFAVANRGKRSLALDLKRKRGRGILFRLVEGADVFIQNFRPGAAEGIGIGEAAVRAHRPDILYVSISGFGESGPYAHKRVYDPVIQALSGLASIQGDRATGRPRMVRTIIPDKLTAMTAAQAITAGLLARERSGEGQHIRLAMLDAMVSFLWPEGMARYIFAQPESAKTVPAPRQQRDLVFRTADGYITAGVVVDREWQAFARAVGHPEWLQDERFRTAAGRIAHWDERLELMQSVLERKTSAEWFEILDRAEVPCAPINGRQELLTDPQIAANELIVETEHPVVGPVRQTRPAARFSGTPAAIRSPAPTVGEHTRELLGELGLGKAEIADLSREGVIG
ncbi:MAG: CoA transferase [Proteobacteria bacterium]|nr:CoA transferase [Pseudomonadota bacterium]